MPHSKRLKLSIDTNRLLDAPVPTHNRDTPEGIEDLDSGPIEEGFDETDIQEVDEGGENQNLIEMGVAFPKGADRPQSTRRTGEQDDREEEQLVDKQEEETQRGIFI